jgi:hypothetical protein
MDCQNLFPHDLTIAKHILIVPELFTANRRPCSISKLYEPFPLPNCMHSTNTVANNFITKRKVHYPTTSILVAGNSNVHVTSSILVIGHERVIFSCCMPTGMQYIDKDKFTYSGKKYILGKYTLDFFS